MKISKEYYRQIRDGFYMRHMHNMILTGHGDRVREVERITSFVPVMNLFRRCRGYVIILDIDIRHFVR